MVSRLATRSSLASFYSMVLTSDARARQGFAFAGLSAALDRPSSTGSYGTHR